MFCDWGFNSGLNWSELWATKLPSVSSQVGNVYVQFQEEEQAAAALQALSGRFYAGRHLQLLPLLPKRACTLFPIRHTAHCPRAPFVPAGRPILVDFSPVTDFREATCRQYEENTCNRGGYCNFMHLKKIGRYLCACLMCQIPVFPLSDLL